MDNSITAKYFRVTGEGTAPLFVNILTELFALAIGDREIDINPGQNNPLIIRLERLDTSRSDFVTGELTRKQIIDIPAEANDAGLQPVQLSQGGGLAYPSAFVYHRQSRVILIQANPIAVSQGRLAHYLYNFNQLASYVFDPVLTTQAWAKFNRGPPRKIVIKLANPSQMIGLTGPANSVAESAANLAEMLEGPTVTIEVSMGQKHGSLARNTVRRIVTSLMGRSFSEVETLSVSVKPDGEQTEVIDFLHEFLAYKDVLDLPENDHEQSYQIRSGALRHDFASNIAHINSLYGAQ